MASTELKNKLSTLSRYAGTTGATLLTVLGALSFLDVQQIAEIKAQVDILNQSLITAYGALTKMWLILGPVGAAVAMKLGWNSSGVKALAGKLLTIASGPASPQAAEAQKALVDATTAIAQDRNIPASLEAKAALIDGAAAQPEVVGKINVTDIALLNATQSDQVQKAA